MESVACNFANMGWYTTQQKSLQNQAVSELHTDAYTIIDVAYNPGVLQAAEKDQGIKDQLIRMAMLCIEERLQFTLAHSYHLTSFRLKGSIQRMKESLMGIKTDFPDLKAMTRTGKSMDVS